MRDGSKGVQTPRTPLNFLKIPDLQIRMGPLMGGGGGSQCPMTILRNNNVALSNLRNGHVPCHYLIKSHVAYVTKARGFEIVKLVLSTNFKN